MGDVKKCFVIAPIGEQDTEIRKRSDQVLKHVITPAVEECGFEPIRADQISEPGIITRQIIQHIIDDPLVLADLTGRNPNVFYELAVRHAIRKPLIQIIAKGEQIPFDVAGTRIIMVDHRDLDSAVEARSEIIRQIRAVTSDPSKVDSPISMSLDLQTLKQSDEPNQRSLADIIEAISEVNLAIKSIQKDFTEEAILRNKGRLLDIVSLSGELRIFAGVAFEDVRMIRNEILEDLEEPKKSKLGQKMQRTHDLFYRLTADTDMLHQLVRALLESDKK